MRTRVMAATAGLALAALAIGACGDDDEPSTSIDATASEFEFEPDAWTAPVGEELTVTFENGGSVDHEWVVIKRGQDLESEADFAEDKVLFEVEASPGKSTTQRFTVDDAGTYQVICAIASHFDAGMEGTLTVK